LIKFPIYLDNFATTITAPEVLDAMLPCFTEFYGNPSSKAHEFGWKAEAIVEKSRKQIANLINCEPRDIIFTSGATESVNLAIKGVAQANQAKGNRIITTKIEHEAVLETCNYLEKIGYEILYLSPDRNGLINPFDLLDLINEKTILVSVMFVNNEIGTIQKIKEISSICKQKKVLFHTDATQAVGKIPIDLTKLNIDLMSFSSHKIYGPKGAGALFKSGKLPRVRVTPQITGGAQEKGLRAGTLNVPAIAGFGKACELAQKNLLSDIKKIKFLRDKLYNSLRSACDGIILNGDLNERVAGNLNICIEGVDANQLMMSVKEIAVSAGSACSSESAKPSHVLQAIGLDKKLLNSAIRFGIGRYNSEQEIDYVIQKFINAINTLRSSSKKYQVNKGEYA
jgi:cysteine desulfurase